MIAKSSRMDQNNENFFGGDITNIESSPKTKKIDDFTRNFKDGTMDFLAHERSDFGSEKVDAQKPKVDVDDFLNFHDDLSENKPQDEPLLLPSFDKPEDNYEEPKVTESDINFHPIEDDYMNPYASSDLKAFTEPQNEKFISSEDLLNDFKDPISAEVEASVEILATFKSPVDVSKPVEVPPPIDVVKPIVEAHVTKPPVTESIKPADVPSKPKTAPPPAPVKKSTPDDTQIEAEKIFKSIGLG